MKSPFILAFFVMALSLSSLAGAQAQLTAPPKEKYESFAMTHGGDPSRGRELFNDPKRLACGQCHAVDGKGAKVGPDLFSIGDKFGRRELVESVLSPSATIAEGYATTIVTTTAGDVIDGIVRESTDASVTLMAADGTLAHIAAADVRERRVSAVSMMPEGLQSALTFAEFADLIDYLASLKTPKTTAATEQGMPATIAEIAQPIALSPIHSPEHKFAHPVWFGPVPGVIGAFAVVEHESGKVWLLDQPGGAGEAKNLFLDAGRVMPGAHGIMAIAFHPKYAENRRYFIVKQPVDKGRFSTQVFEGRAAADLRSDSTAPMRKIIEIDGSTSNHCGGGLEFGPDGYLYIAMGDSGPQQDPHGNAQDMNLLRGKMLRIDVDRAGESTPYAIPPDNPFVGRKGVRPEIWASGLREPWRYSFDPLTNDLWVGDVGQDLYEEVDIVRKGENYGWNVTEGFAPFSNQYRRPGERYVPPLFAYSRKYGVSVTGGYVYRADPKSIFYGVYIFADFQTRRIFGLTKANGALKTVRQIGLSPQRVVSFGRDDRGVLYLVGYEGTIYKMDFDNARFE
jgi:putative heme-binding domain-containing protein